MKLKRTPAPATDRGSISKARKSRLWQRDGGLCRDCGCAVRMTGPRTVYDHLIPLELSGPDTDDNIHPICIPCDKIKYPIDMAAIAKARRIRKTEAGDDKPSRMKNRPFQTKVTRGFDGKVKPRKISAKALRGQI